MAGIPKSRRINNLGLRLAITIVSALTFASPASAETTTLVCEPDAGGSPWIFTVDYSAATITRDGSQSAAVITAEEIKFRFQRDPHGNVVGSIIEGAISRLAGTMDVSYSMTDGNGIYASEQVRGRCRPATQKF